MLKQLGKHFSLSLLRKTERFRSPRLHLCWDLHRMEVLKTYKVHLALLVVPEANVFILTHNSVSPRQSHNHCMGEVLGVVLVIKSLTSWVLGTGNKTWNSFSQSSNLFHWVIDLVFSLLALSLSITILTC